MPHPVRPAEQLWFEAALATSAKIVAKQVDVHKYYILTLTRCSTAFLPRKALKLLFSAFFYLVVDLYH